MTLLGDRPSTWTLATVRPMRLIRPLKSIYTNAGNGTHLRDRTLRLGTVLINGWSAYASLTMQKARCWNDIRTSAVWCWPARASSLR